MTYAEADMASIKGLVQALCLAAKRHPCTIRSNHHIAIGKKNNENAQEHSFAEMTQFKSTNTNQQSRQCNSRA